MFDDLDLARLGEPFPGVEVLRTPQALWVRSAAPLNVLSSGMAGGGYLQTRHILNLHVHKDYAGDDPSGDLSGCARSLGIDEPFAGLMTAAMIDRAAPFSAQMGAVGVCVLATIGLGNAAAAGITPPAGWQPGTINIIVIADACLTPAALVNLAITVTEAKCDFLRRLGWRTAEGEQATGTSTDALALASTGRGPALPYAGPATPVGYLAARLVRQALEAYR
jgi:iron complex transport system ATP-binding protein